MHPTFSSQIGPVRASALEGNGKAPYEPRGDVAQSQYHFLFPSSRLMGESEKLIAEQRRVYDALLA